MIYSEYVACIRCLKREDSIESFLFCFQVNASIRNFGVKKHMWAVPFCKISAMKAQIFMKAQAKVDIIIPYPVVFQPRPFNIG